MKPILYEATETDFLTQGLGVLYDTISCTVTEERNGIYECKLVYDINGAHFSEIEPDRIVLIKPNDFDDPQPFRIYRITKPINGRVSIYGEHISYMLSKIPVAPFAADSVVTALQGLSGNAMISCPFTFWTDKTTTANFSVKEPASIRSRLGGTQGSILDVYGGEWHFDKWTCRLYNNRGQDRGVLLRYGKNITDFTQEENIANTNTGIVPIWRGMDEDGEEIVVTLETDPIIYADNAGQFPYQKVVVVDLSDRFVDEPTQTQLRNAAQSYVTSNNIGIPSVSIEVSFAALWQTEEYKNLIGLEQVRLCDTVTVEFEKLGVSASAKVVKTVYNALTERYDSITLGEIRTSLSKSLSEVSTQVLNTARKEYVSLSALEKAINHATNLITGGLGGYVVMKLNANDQPEEILVLGDSPDYTVAQKVWRWNRNGLGYSSTGYNGTYRTALTHDGHFVADFIDTGTLNAALITVLHLSASSIDTGALTVKDNNDNIIFKADISNKTVEINGDYVTLGNLSLANAILAAENDVIDTIDTSLTQQDIFNRLTNNGAAQGLALINGQLYISFSYAQGGTLTLGGTNNGNGLLVVKNAGDQEIGRWGNAGIQISKGSIALGDDGNGNAYTTIDDNGRIDTAKLYATYGAFGDLQLVDSSLRYNTPFIPTTNDQNRIYVGKYGVSVSGDYSDDCVKRSILQKGELSFWQELVLNGAVNEVFRIQTDSGDHTIGKAEIWLSGSNARLQPVAAKRFFAGNYAHSHVYVDVIDVSLDSYMEIFRGNSRAFYIGSSGTEVRGDFSVTGTKNRVVSTEDYSDRLLYCYEMPSPMFGDVGEGVIAEDGYAYIQIDPVFQETIESGQYQVFLQKYGQGDCYVKERKPTYFVVAGTSGMPFAWEIKAKQAGYNQMRLNRFEKHDEIKNAIDYAQDAEDHIYAIQYERGTNR